MGKPSCKDCGGRKGLVVTVSSILAALMIGASPASPALQPWHAAVQGPQGVFGMDILGRYWAIGELVAAGEDPGRVGRMTDEELEAELERLGGAPRVDDPSKLSNIEIGGWVMGVQGDMTIIEIHIGDWIGEIQVPTVNLAHFEQPPPPASGTQGEVDWTDPNLDSLNCYERAERDGVPPEDVC